MKRSDLIPPPYLWTPSKVLRPPDNRRFMSHHRVCCCGPASCPCPSVSTCTWCATRGFDTPTHFTVTFTGVTLCQDCFDRTTSSAKFDPVLTLNGTFVLAQAGSCEWRYHEDQLTVDSWSNNDCTGTKAEDETFFGQDRGITLLMPDPGTSDNWELIYSLNPGSGSREYVVYADIFTRVDCCFEVTNSTNDLAAKACQDDITADYNWSTLFSDGGGPGGGGDALVQGRTGTATVTPCDVT